MLKKTNKHTDAKTLLRIAQCLFSSGIRVSTGRITVTIPKPASFALIGATRKNISEKFISTCGSQERMVKPVNTGVSMFY